MRNVLRPMSVNGIYQLFCACASLSIKRHGKQASNNEVDIIKFKYTAQFNNKIYHFRCTWLVASEFQFRQFPLEGVHIAHRLWLTSVLYFFLLERKLILKYPMLMLSFSCCMVIVRVTCEHSLKPMIGRLMSYFSITGMFCVQ